jgi:hypothetical protein
LINLIKVRCEINCSRAERFREDKDKEEVFFLARHRRLRFFFGFISLWKYIAQSSQGTSKDIIIITEAAQHLYGADVPACIIISERKRGWRKILFCENKDVGSSKTTTFAILPNYITLCKRNYPLFGLQNRCAHRALKTNSNFGEEATCITQPIPLELFYDD